MELNRHTLRIPHCLNNKSMIWLLRVRRGNSSYSTPFEELPHMEEFGNFRSCYSANENIVTISATEFSEFVCTTCNTTCLATIKTFLFGSLDNWRDDETTTVEIKSFLCSPLFRIAEFRDVSPCIL